jgi:hypothetical protein
MSDLPHIYPIPRWRLRVCRLLLGGMSHNSSCPKHYDEYGYPTSNISGCIWCALDTWEDTHKAIQLQLTRYVRQYGPEPSPESRCPHCNGTGKKS